MTKQLEQAIEAARQTSETTQDELALMIKRRILDERLAASDASYAAKGGKPAAEVFNRLIRKYGGQG